MLRSKPSAFGPTQCVRICVLLLSCQRVRSDPARVVFFHQSVICEDGPGLMTVALIVHAAPGKRLNLPAQLAVEIRVFVPTNGVKKEVSDGSFRPGKQAIRRKRER